MTSIVSQIVMVLMNRDLNNGSVNWFCMRRRNLPQYPIMKNIFVLALKPRADVNRNPEQGHQWPHKKASYPPFFLKKERIFLS